MHFQAADGDTLCPLVEKIDPAKYLYKPETLKYILRDQDFSSQSLKKLSEAVRVPTQIFDDMVNPNRAESLEDLYKLDPRWRPFEQFHEYLLHSFPLVHSNLKVEKINKFALVYTWEGLEAGKKPILLTAHQDVVPIQKDTLPQWTFPPFEAGFKEGYLYGRGASDCKNLLVGLLETIELLLSEKTFKPKRTIVLGFGYDEESMGTGAQAISKHLTAKYGPDSFYQLVDEGTEGFVEFEGDKYIIPATGEKGHLNSFLEIFTPGGHSSIPPKHTSIGLLARVISRIEDKEYQSVITNANPVLNQLQCAAEHSKNIDPKLRKNILQAHLNKQANEVVLEHLSRSIEGKYLVTTSQAVDIILGGVKSNALPEHASVLINHRIAIEESVDLTRNKILGQVKTFARNYDMGLYADGKVILKATQRGYFNYLSLEELEPAPVTPINNQIWNNFGGAVRYLYEDLLGHNDTFIVSPYISTGNTDTRFYWDLTRNIYRFSPTIPGKASNIHSVDESLLFESHLHIIAFYYYYLQMVDVLDDSTPESTPQQQGF